MSFDLRLRYEDDDDVCAVEGSARRQQHIRTSMAKSVAYPGVGHQRAHPRERCDADNCALAVDVDSSDGDGGDESGGGDDAAAAR